MDLLLISPPVANFGQATAGISVLTADLRHRGWDAQQWDLAIDAFHHFHSPEHLARCQRTVEEHGCDARVSELATHVVAHIEEAKAALRVPGVERDHDAMRDAFQTISDAGVLLTAASRGRYEHSFRHFTVKDAFRDYDGMQAALGDQGQNPYLEYFEQVVLPRIERDRPRAVGISFTYFSQLVPGFTLLRLLRDRFGELPLVIGGAYLTAVHDDVPRIRRDVVPADAIVVHDGEGALDAWLGATLEGRGAPELDNLLLPGARGFVPSGTTPGGQTDLDSLPVPMWTPDGLDLSRYLVPRYPIPLPLSRGCYWGRCNYCNISAQASSSYRTRSVELAIRDMRALVEETGSTWFDFPVDSFRPRELWELSKAIVAEGLEVEWGAEVLLDGGFRDEVLEDMARSGCRCLRFGMESANKRVLEAMNKPNRPKETERILTTCTRLGIQTAVMCIAGYPTETQGDLWETFDYLVEHKDVIDFVTIHQYSLVPGSRMAADPAAFGLMKLPQAAVLWSSLPFANTNPVGMRSEDLPRVIRAMREGLKEHYPDIDEMWTVAIGGWMTFPACCRERQAPNPGGGEDVGAGEAAAPA